MKMRFVSYIGAKENDKEMALYQCTACKKVEADTWDAVLICGCDEKVTP